MASITQWIKSQLFLSIPRPRESLESKVIIITGANTGLGLEAARHCVHLNAFKVILAVRSESRGQEAKRDIEATTKRYGVVEVCLLDLASYDSIKAFVAEMARLPRIDAIIENAGIAGLDYRVIEDNEGMITVNVVSTMLLATLMLPVLSASAKKHDTTGMISIVSSETHAWAKFREQRCDEIFRTLNDKGKANMAERYYLTKLLSLLSTRALAEQSRASRPNVTVNIVNPGFCSSGLFRELSGFKKLQFRLLVAIFARSPEHGSRALVHGILADRGSHGKYMSDGVVDESQLSPFVRSYDGRTAQMKVWEELLKKLEGIEPGVPGCIVGSTE